MEPSRKRSRAASPTPVAMAHLPPRPTLSTSTSLLDPPDDTLRLDARCLYKASGHVPFLCSFRRLSALGYSAIDTVEVTNSFEGDVPEWDDAPTSIPQLFGSAAGHAALRGADALSRVLRRARAVRHLKVEDDGFDEKHSPDVRPPGTVLVFCLVARAAAPLPLARFVASTAAVAGLEGLALHPAREHLRELGVYGLDRGDADQAAEVSAVLGTAARRLTRLELYVMPWPPNGPGPGRLAALAQPLSWAAAAGPMPALRSLTVGCLLCAALAAAVAANCPALTELVLHSATEVQSDGGGVGGGQQPRQRRAGGERRRDRRRRGVGRSRLGVAPPPLHAPVAMADGRHGGSGSGCGGRTAAERIHVGRRHVGGRHHGPAAAAGGGDGHPHAPGCHRRRVVRETHGRGWWRPHVRVVQRDGGRFEAARRAADEGHPPAEWEGRCRGGDSRRCLLVLVGTVGNRVRSGDGAHARCVHVMRRSHPI